MSVWPWARGSLDTADRVGYWSNLNDGEVMACALTGCLDGGTTLASGQNSPEAVAVDTSTVYWTNGASGQVMKCTIGGCNGSPVVFASSQASPTVVALDANNVYWTDFGSPDVHSTDGRVVMQAK